ncbi:MAG: DNA primase [Patescibacteria group bacterium]
MINSPVEEIKSKLDIIEVIGSYLKLEKAGINYRGVCPFHNEKKPSFFVSPTRQMFKCFGCGKSGDMFTFVQEIEGVEFGDALRTLAQKAGVELKKQNPKLITERKRLYDICELSTRFFEKQLESKIGKEVKQYFLDRGINEASMIKWRLGWSPDLWSGLIDFLVSKGFKTSEIERAGLAILSQKGTHFDRFRGRIMFPVFDLNSQVIGFGGRIFKQSDTAKYMNTPATMLYDKGRTLYGLDKAKLAIRKKNFCIISEGYADIILSSQIGIENIVASSGTALTPHQLRILKRYSDNLYIAFDMDIAGNTATKRGIDLAQAQGFNIKVITLPGENDPADVISKHPGEFEKLIEKAKGIMEFYFEGALASHDPKSPDGKKEISKILLPVIKKIPNKIEQSFWIQELVKILGINEEAIREELDKAKLTEDSLGLEPEEIANIPVETRKSSLEDNLIIESLRDQKLLNHVRPEDLELFSDKARQIIECLKEKKEIPAELSDVFNSLSLKAEVKYEDEDENEEFEEDFNNCLNNLRSFFVKEKLDEISQGIRMAEGEKDKEKIKKLTEEFNYWTKKFHGEQKEKN